MPISESTLKEARRLLTLLPSSIPVPYIAPAPTGALTLEWRRRDTQAFVLSIKGEKTINFMVLDVEGNRYGVGKFTSTIPDAIGRELQSFFENI